MKTFNSRKIPLDDPNVLWNEWKNKFLLVCDRHASPTTRKFRSEYTPWLSDNIIKLMRNRDYPKKKAFQTNLDGLHQAYKRLRNNVNKTIKKTKTIKFPTILRKHGKQSTNY